MSEQRLSELLVNGDNMIDPIPITRYENYYDAMRNGCTVSSGEMENSEGQVNKVHTHLAPELFTIIV